MITIHKFILPIESFFRLPIRGYIKGLSVESQGDSIVYYAMVDTEKLATTEVSFRICGTGHELPTERIMQNWNFLGTVKLRDGAYMFHVFGG